MLPGPTLILACGANTAGKTACKARFACPTLATGNTFYARFWTDGFRIAPRIDRPPGVCQCPECNGVFLLKHAGHVDTVDPYTYRYTRRTLASKGPFLDLVQPSVATYYHAMSEGLSQVTKNDPQDEVLFRTFACWKYHHFFRRTLQFAKFKLTDDNNEEHFEFCRQAQEKNLEEMVFLLDQNIGDMPRDDQQNEQAYEYSLQKADCLRELGQYFDALDVLKEIPSASRLSSRARVLESLCLAKDPFVYELEYDSKNNQMITK